MDTNPMLPPAPHHLAHHAPGDGSDHAVSPVDRTGRRTPTSSTVRIRVSGASDTMDRRTNAGPGSLRTRFRAMPQAPVRTGGPARAA
ncbi:hypothetical protein [Streptomyces atroolivaceus]|uniref:hypothetical protein n=1 Tax=Streptomyces atroolivaceus TaxID=66869 RepID=UPI002024E25B|nr:hypothetical protein [Streptomyces atroolivaceus]